jgi:hypothetical protein
MGYCGLNAAAWSEVTGTSEVPVTFTPTYTNQRP